MDLEAGRMLAHYRLTEKIGEGGMGVVWKALDTTLDREVAIKVLPRAFAEDADRLARFGREAKVLASLNHPNIATIHGLHEDEGTRFLAMELVAGRDLARLLEDGALPVERCIEIGRQVAEALEAAHESGIVHRDLKPANVVVSPTGQIKVLDFGLAKPAADPSGSVDASLSPTLTTAGTQAGMILGTAAYLSPEQAKGQPVDRRADIWAFGVLMHEMLTGKRTFKGEGISETLAAVILKEPDLEELPAGTPPRVRRLIQRCLVKDPRRRMRDIGEARLVLEEPGEPDAALASEAPAADGSSAPRAAGRGLVVLVAGFLAVAAFLAGVWLRPAAPADRPIHLRAQVSGTEGLGMEVGMPVALSPDGTTAALVLGDPPQIHVRDLQRLEATLLSGTEGAMQPFFSPDGEWIAFFTQGSLKKVSVRGGAPLTLSDASRPRGGTWGPDDTIVYAPTTTSGLHRISAAGGETVEVTTLSEEGVRERSHRWPQFLPGGEAVLFTAQDRGDNFNESRIERFEFATGERSVVQPGGSYPLLVPGGFLVFGREGTLFASRYDVGRNEVLRSPVPVLEGVRTFAANGAVDVAVSSTGTLVYLDGGTADAAWRGTIALVDGGGEQRPLSVDPDSYRDAVLSPDGRQIAFTLDTPSQNNADIWVYDLAREVATRLTFGESRNWYPSWTPDGKFITFSSTRESDMMIYRKRADGSGDAERISGDGSGMWAGGSWSPDGRYLAVTAFDTQNDILVFDLEKGGAPSKFVDSEASETFPAFSPDGRWIAYGSRESGRTEVYVRPFPGPGGRWQVSRDGGERPGWSRDGREILYVHDETNMRAASVEASGDSLRIGRPREVFTSDLDIRGMWSVGADGVLAMTLVEDELDASDDEALVTVVFHWPSELEEMVPR